jgi:hypothetical protein
MKYRTMAGEGACNMKSSWVPGNSFRPVSVPRPVFTLRTPMVAFFRPVEPMRPIQAAFG